MEANAYFLGYVRRDDELEIFGEIVSWCSNLVDNWFEVVVLDGFIYFRVVYTQV